MGEVSSIAWTDATWNPWRGCDKISPACAHCYMFTDQRRYGKDPDVVVRAAPATFNAPLTPRWSRRAEACAAEGRPHLVFTCSWSDWFHEDADAWREEAWDVIRRTPQHTYQVLTKRPERILDHLPADWGSGWPNVWLGVTIENRRFVDRADLLRAVPAVVRFISAEPLLGELKGLRLDGIDWVIIGGESGAKARRMRPEWASSLLDHVRGSQAVPFVKQTGEVLARELALRDRKGENESEWPTWLRVREMPLERQA